MELRADDGDAGRLHNPFTVDAAKCCRCFGYCEVKPDKTSHLNAIKRGLNPGFKSSLEMRVLVLISTHAPSVCSELLKVLCGCRTIHNVTALYCST